MVLFYGLSERVRKKNPISRERYRSMSEHENFLGTQPIGKLLLKFSVPCVLSMLVSALYNIVDQVFIGQSGVFADGRSCRAGISGYEQAGSQNAGFAGFVCRYRCGCRLLTNRKLLKLLQVTA